MQNKANFGDALRVTRGHTRENPNEYVPCNVSTVSFLVIFVKSLLEKVDRRCGKLLNFMSLWIVAPVAQLDRVADFENFSESSLSHKYR